MDDTHTPYWIGRRAQSLRGLFEGPCVLFRANTDLRDSAQAERNRSVQQVPAKEAVMDDRQKDEARTPQTPRYVTDRQMHRVLDECLWQVERRRVDPAESSEKSPTIASGS